ncbi:MAG: cation:proton antiporter [Gemmatimonadota bacterium]
MNAGTESVTQVLGIVAVVLLSAKILGEIAERLRQPAVIGELLAGLLLGPSLFGILDPAASSIHLLAETGVVILLFSIGLETPFKNLLRVGGPSTAVACIGVALPFAGGYFACRALGLTNEQSIVMGAALTATSVGITARVLGDLGILQRPESQVILGAAVIDDVIGLIILAVVADAVSGSAITLANIGMTTVFAFGFLALALLIGSWLAQPLMGLIERWTRPEVMATTAIALAFLFSLAAESSGSAPIVGAFAAGMVLASTPQAHSIAHGMRSVGAFFVPIFFVAVGAAVDIRAFAEPATLMIGGILLAIGIAGKVLAGAGAWRFHGQRLFIGVGMIPRGEVGLIFAQLGLSLAVLDSALFSALALVVFVTTFMTPPLLKRLAITEGGEPPQRSTIGDLVGEI